MQFLSLIYLKSVLLPLLMKPHKVQQWRPLITFWRTVRTLCPLFRLNGWMWLTLNGHHPHVDDQLECAGVGASPDIPDPPRVVLDPSSYGGVPYGNEEQAV